MEYINKDLNSYKLHLIKTDKFKTVTIKVLFRSPIVKEEITIRNVLCDILLQSTKNYDSRRKISIKAEDLYSLHINNSVIRNGNYITSSFTMSILNDKYTEDNNMLESIKFLSEVLFNPDVKDKKFNEDRLNIVKNNIKNNINSIKENPTKYSIIRLSEVYNKGPISYRLTGYLDDLDNINTSNLYDYYLKFIKNSLIDIYVVGDIDFREVTKYIRSNFKFRTINKERVPLSLKLIKPRRKVLISKESSNNVQTNIGIMCNISNLTKYERDYVLPVYNLLLGGGVDSKLFKNVREKYSLCYTIRSYVRTLDNTITIIAGIDNNNFLKCIDLIKKYFQEIKKGKFDTKDIKVAKEYLITSMDDIYEDSNSIISYYFSKELLKLDELDIRKEKINKVKKHEIIRLSKKIKIDTIFNLEGGQNNGN